jgi:hypothetical protein
MTGVDGTLRVIHGVLDRLKSGLQRLGQSCKQKPTMPLYLLDKN